MLPLGDLTSGLRYADDAVTRLPRRGMGYGQAALAGGALSVGAPTIIPAIGDLLDAGVGMFNKGLGIESSSSDTTAGGALQSALGFLDKPRQFAWSMIPGLHNPDSGEAYSGEEALNRMFGFVPPTEQPSDPGAMYRFPETAEPPLADPGRQLHPGELPPLTQSDKLPRAAQRMPMQDLGWLGKGGGFLLEAMLDPLSLAGPLAGVAGLRGARAAGKVADVNQAARQGAEALSGLRPAWAGLSSAEDAYRSRLSGVMVDPNTPWNITHADRSVIGQVVPKISTVEGHHPHLDDPKSKYYSEPTPPPGVEVRTEELRDKLLNNLNSEDYLGQMGNLENFGPRGMYGDLGSVIKEPQSDFLKYMLQRQGFGSPIYNAFGDTSGKFFLANDPLTRSKFGFGREAGNIGKLQQIAEVAPHERGPLWKLFEPQLPTQPTAGGVLGHDSPLLRSLGIDTGSPAGQAAADLMSRIEGVEGLADVDRQSLPMLERLLARLFTDNPLGV